MFDLSFIKAKQMVRLNQFQFYKQTCLFAGILMPQISCIFYTLNKYIRLQHIPGTHLTIEF